MRSKQCKVQWPNATFSQRLIQTVSIFRMKGNHTTWNTIYTLQQWFYAMDFIWNLVENLSSYRHCLFRKNGDLQEILTRMMNHPISFSANLSKWRGSAQWVIQGMHVSYANIYIYRNMCVCVCVCIYIYNHDSLRPPGGPRMYRTSLLVQFPAFWKMQKLGGYNHHNPPTPLGNHK